MLKPHFIIFFLSIIGVSLLKAETQKPFLGIWKPSLEATMESVQSSSEVDPNQADKMKKILAQLIPTMRLQIGSDKLEMQMRKSRSQSFSYTLEDVSKEQMSIMLEAGPDKQMPCKVLMVDEGLIQLNFGENNDMNVYVWEPAKSMETKEPNLAAIAAAAGEAPKANGGARTVSEVAREKMIRNNLRQIASAADQYFLENGVTEVGYAELEGEYFKPLKSVNGEDYGQLTIKFRNDIKVVDKDGKEHVYSK